MSAPEPLNFRQRACRAGVIALAINVPLCWLASLAVLSLSPNAIVAQVTLAPLLIASAANATALLAAFGVKGVLPVVRRIPVSRVRFRGGLILWTVLAVVSAILGLIVFSRVAAPSGTGVLGTAARLPDGRHALLSHGSIVRYLSDEEFRQALSSDLLGIIAVVLILCLAISGLIASKLWRRSD
jgi:hypothetical protein